MKKETAVEWLVEQLFIASGIEVTKENNPPLFELIEQAKAMEKEQIIEANEDCSINELGELFTGEQYYTSTFGS